MKVLIVSREHDVAHRPYDGFSKRHLDLVEALAAEFEVEICLLEGGDAPSRTIIDRTTARLPGSPETVPGRLRRLSRAARYRLNHLDAAERKLAAHVQQAEADALITIGPWIDIGYRAAYGATPSMYLFEEDLSRMPELAPQSRQARLLRDCESALRGRRCRQPDIVVVISPAEVAYARRRFPRSEVMVVPYYLPQDQAPLRIDWSATGSHVFVPGVLSESRNAEGVADVLRHLQQISSDMPILLSSAAGYHEVLRPYLSLPTVTVAPPTKSSLAECYDMAKVVLIAPKRVSGTKTTLVEAWAARRPVVCSEPVAVASPLDAEAYIRASSPEDLALALSDVWNDSCLQDRLVRSGDTALGSRSRMVQVRRVVAVLRSIAE